MKLIPSTAACLLLVFLAPSFAAAELRAGAAVVDVTPVQLPVLVNGGMLSRTTDNITTRLHARAIVLDDGDERLGIVVVDSCMMPRPFLDEAKQLASQRTKIRPERMLISATHTHTAPASMGCLGTSPDPTYVPYLREKIAEALAAAEANLEPARVGWAVRNAAPFTAVRRWIRRPDRIANDPFGNPTVRANMHAGANWDDVTGESGPEDPDLSLIALQNTNGRPIAVLANFSMHYFSGQRGLSSDYFGRFCDGLADHLGSGRDGNAPPFVGLMSHGCSGDIWRRDYKVPADQRPDPTIDEYATGLVNIALEAYETIEYESDVDLAMAEARMTLDYRVPDAQRLAWAQRVVEAMGDRPPKDSTEVYAREQLILHERQSTEVCVQAVRIGDIGIATTPNETYALTGLKLKRQSPLPNTMVIELANGGDGYIPPPEQHYLGGYNTWAARSAGLEVQAEPKIAETALTLLEQVAGKPRQAYRQPRGPAAEAILAAQPSAYWRLDEFAGPHAADSSGHQQDAVYEQGVVFFLAGPDSKAYCGGDQQNRAAHFAGGRLRVRLPQVGEPYSIALSFWNGMPVEGRDVAGWMFSRGPDHSPAERGEHLGLGGAGGHAGKLIWAAGNDTRAAGQTTIERWSWHRVVLVRDEAGVRVYLDGKSEPEIELSAPAAAAASEQWFFGGRSDNQANWEGRLDEIAVFDRALSVAEIQRLAGGE